MGGTSSKSKSAASSPQKDPLEAAALQEKKKLQEQQLQALQIETQNWLQHVCQLESNPLIASLIENLDEDECPGLLTEYAYFKHKKSKTSFDHSGLDHGQMGSSPASLHSNISTFRRGSFKERDSSASNLKYRNGDTYQGAVKNKDEKHGYGVYICYDKKRTSGYEYHGPWRDDLRDGKDGKCFYYDEDFYIGDWKKDKRDGSGELFFSRKYKEQRYIGKWRNDYMHGRGTLISSGGSSPGQQGGQEHFEGEFVKGMKHGLGILKVTINYQRYSAKPREVKVYEQEWRSNKLVESRQIHVVVGDAKINKLFLNTDQIRYDNYQQLELLCLYSRNTKTGDIDFYDNLKTFRDSELLSQSALSQESKQQRRPEVESQSDARFRDFVLHGITGYQEFVSFYQASKVRTQVQGLCEFSYKDALLREESQQVDSLIYDFQNSPERVRTWTTPELLTYLLHQNVVKIDYATYQKVCDSLIKNRVIGEAFFSKESEADLKEAFQLKQLGIRKNLMRIIKNFRKIEEQKAAHTADLRILESLKAQQIEILDKEAKRGRSEGGGFDNFRMFRFNTFHKKRDPLTNFTDPKLTSRSQDQHKRDNSKWTNVQGMLSGAVSGFSAFMWGKQGGGEANSNEAQLNANNLKAGFDHDDLSHIDKELAGDLRGEIETFQSPTFEEFLDCELIADNQKEGKASVVVGGGGSGFEEPVQADSRSAALNDLNSVFVSQIVEVKARQEESKSTAPPLKGHGLNVETQFYAEEFNRKLHAETHKRGSRVEGINSKIQTYLEEDDQSSSQEVFIKKNQNQSPRGISRPNRQMSSHQSNERFMKHILGNRGIHGINIQKVLQSNVMTKTENSQSHTPMGKISRQQTKEYEPELERKDMAIKMNFSENLLLGTHLHNSGTMESSTSKRRKHQNEIGSSGVSGHHQFRHTMVHSGNMSRLEGRRITSRKIAMSSQMKDNGFLLGIGDVERIKREKNRENKKKNMSRNLINILFTTEKDKERERIKKEKEKLKAFAIPSSRSRTSKTSKQAASRYEGTRPGSRRLGDDLSEVTRQSEFKVPNSGIDDDLFIYLEEKFNDNGFNFFIEREELKFNEKTDFLGVGGYGEVFKGLWMSMPVAIKLFNRRCHSKKNIFDFIKEIEMVNQIRHPNIIFYMGLTCDENQHYYMVTEFAQRGSIFDLLHNNGNKKAIVQMDDAQIFKVSQEMALAIQYLHSKQILHCDLKSQNILMDENWVVKICDFGLSRYQTKFQRENIGKVGTPHWMAPEILRGEPYTEASDVYSFGVILWELVTGEIPHRGRSVAQIVGSVGFHGERLNLEFKSRGRNLCKHESLPGLEKSIKEMQPGLRHFRLLIEMCCSEKPEKRPTFKDILEYSQVLDDRQKIQEQYDKLNSLIA